MGALRVEILNEKALQLIKGMQDLNLIKVTEEPASSVQDYLNNMRRKASAAPSLGEITQVVEEVRSKRYGKKG